MDKVRDAYSWASLILMGLLVAFTIVRAIT